MKINTTHERDLMTGPLYRLLKGLGLDMLSVTVPMRHRLKVSLGSGIVLSVNWRDMAYSHCGKAYHLKQVDYEDDYVREVITSTPTYEIAFLSGSSFVNPSEYDDVWPEMTLADIKREVTSFLSEG